MEVVGFLMMAHMIPPQELLEQARLMESYGADCVYVTDSAGALTPDGFRERVRALREGARASRSASTRTTTSARPWRTASRPSTRARRS